MTRPAGTMSKDSTFDSEKRCPREDLIGGDAIHPTDSKYSLELRLLGPLQTFDVSTIPGQASVKKGGEGHFPLEYDFGSHSEALFSEDSIREHSVLDQLLTLMSRSLLQMTYAI